MSNFKDSPKFSKKFTETAKSIQKRQKPNDVFITPEILAKNHIASIPYTEDDIWLDPFKNSGNYYNNFPKECKKDWCEILKGRDFFKYEGKVHKYFGNIRIHKPNIICSNPPYSILDRVIKKSIELKPRIISYLIGLHNLTTRRIEIFNKADYGLTSLKMCKIYKWFGMSAIVTFTKDQPNMEGFGYDRTVYRMNQ